MTNRVAIAIVLAGLLGSAVRAQVVPATQHEQLAPKFVDLDRGLTLDEAIVRALEHEPSVRAARTDIEAARGMRVQAGLRPNPTVSFTRQEEPTSTDNETGIAVQWPLDLFRKRGRVAVADQELEATRLAVADRERVLASEVRLKYGEVVAAVREVAVSDDLVTGHETAIRASARSGRSGRHTTARARHAAGGVAAPRI